MHYMLLITQIIFWLNNGNLKKKNRKKIRERGRKMAGGIFTGNLVIRSLQERQLKKLGNATEGPK